MNSTEMKERTKKFGLRIINLVRALPKTDEARIIGKQVLRAGTSVGANYRAACRARSTKDFIAKICIVEEECDESIYWMEVLIESGIVKQGRLSGLMKEGNELLSIIVASIMTSRHNESRKK